MLVGFLKKAAQVSQPVAQRLREPEDLASGEHRDRWLPSPQPVPGSVAELGSWCDGPGRHRLP